MHWVQTYYLRVDELFDTSNIPTTCGTCYYGQCGLTGKCECADGYQGNDCGTGRFQLSRHLSLRHYVFFVYGVIVV